MGVTVLQISDTHFSAVADGRVSGYHPEGRLETVLTAWAATGRTADLVLLTGDDTDDGAPDAYIRLQSQLSTLNAPVLAIAGNHDDSGEVARCFGGADIAELGAWRVIGIDSSRPGIVHGTVDIAAASELLDALDERPTLLAIHHPPRSRSTGRYFQLDGAEEFLTALAARPHVRAVVSGHLHDAFEFTGPGGLALLGCPSTLMAISHDGDSYTVGADGPTGARVLVLEDDGTMSSTLLIA